MNRKGLWAMFFVFSQILDEFDAIIATENNWLKICIDNDYG